MMWPQQLHHVLVHKLKWEWDQHCCPCDHTQTITWSRILIYWSYIEKIDANEKNSAITLLQVKTNLVTSAELTKTILFNGKIFRKNSPKTAGILIKLAQKNATRNSKKNPATQQEKQPNCTGRPPNWEHWRSHTEKCLLPQLEANTWRFVAMLLLRDKVQQ